MAKGLFPNLNNSINKALGIQGSTNIGTNKKAPWENWNGSNTDGDIFFSPWVIKPERWNKTFPYRLLVYDVSKGAIVAGSSGSGNVTNEYSYLEGNGFILSQEAADPNWIYNFQLTPQQFTVADQYSINTTSTMRGIVEEHNGVKFKNVTIAGTTGVWPKKPTIAGTPKAPSFLGSALGGTLEATKKLNESLSRIANAATGKHPSGSTNWDKPEDLGQIQSTGYYQALLLSQFLERYAQAKKNPENKSWRLVLDNPKENQSFVVTPINFSLQKNQQHPHMYNYSLQLKAWKRINLSIQPIDPPTFQGIDANFLQRMNSTIRETRRALSNSINLIKAVRGDFQGPLNTLRQTALAVKDLGGLAFTAADLPRQIQNDYKSSLKDALYITRNSFKRDSTQRANQGTGGASSSSLKNSSSTVRAAAAVSAITSDKLTHEGVSDSFVASGALGVGASQLNQVDPLNNIFQNPEENFELFDSVNLDSLTLTPEQTQRIEDEIENIRLINIDDLRNFRNTIESLAYDIANNFGAGDSTYAYVYGKPTPKTRIFEMTTEENELLTYLYETIQCYDVLTATLSWDDIKIESPLGYVGGIAKDAGLTFNDSSSKFLVPVPFGLTIEAIAARYLANPDRWIEIATLNNLRSPYIDETGFTYSFLSNGDGRQFNVDDSSQKLYIGQRIVLQSDTVPQFIRNVVSVEKISDTNYLITVDGLANLDSLTTIGNARMRGYLPGTVNSQNQIYIPSDAPSDPDDRVKKIDAFSEDKLVKISKVDFLITDDGDLALNSLGEFRLAAGLNNLIQALKIKVKTKKNTLLNHLDFGLGLTQGISVADIEAGELINEFNRIIKQDPRYSRVSRIQIKVQPPQITIDMAVEVANGNGVIPISFTV
jgi:hypothetical protein